MTFKVSVAGLPVEVEAGRDDDLASLRHVFGGCRPLEPEAVCDHGLVWQDDAITRPDRAPDRVTVDARFWLDEAGSTAVHDGGLSGTLEGDRVRLGGRVADVDPLRSLRIALQLPFAQLLGRVGRHVVHGALVRRSGHGVIVLGRSGAGKSTAAFSAASHGWEVLSDDLSVVSRRAAGEIVAHGFPKPLHVPGELFGRVPAEGTHIVGDARGRVSLPPPATDAATGCRLIGVVGVGHSTGPAELVEFAPGPTRLRPLLDSFLMGETVWGTRQVFLTAIALSRLPAAELRHDADPARRSGEAGRLLDDLAHRWQATNRDCQ